MAIVCQNFIGNNIVEAAERKDDSKHKNKDRKEESKMLDEIYEKLDANIVLLDDEVELLDLQYDNIEITLPNDSIAWEIDHEKNPELSEISTYSVAVSAGIHRTSYTTIVSDVSFKVGNYDLSTDVFEIYL